MCREVKVCINLTFVFQPQTGLGSEWRYLEIAQLLPVRGQWKRTEAGGPHQEERHFSLGRSEWEGEQTESVSALSKSMWTGSCILPGMLMLGSGEDGYAGGGGLCDTMTQRFLVGIDNWASQICCLGHDVILTLQIQGHVVGILAVMHFLSGFLLPGCHSAPSWLADLVWACLVVSCSAMKNKVLFVWDSSSSGCVFGWSWSRGL